MCLDTLVTLQPVNPRRKVPAKKPKCKSRYVGRIYLFRHATHPPSLKRFFVHMLCNLFYPNTNHQWPKDIRSITCQRNLSKERYMVSIPYILYGLITIVSNIGIPI